MKKEIPIDIKIINEKILDLIKSKFTGSLTINFHKGNISKKISKKLYELVELKQG